jgi:hypothetical protein
MMASINTFPTSISSTPAANAPGFAVFVTAGITVGIPVQLPSLSIASGNDLAVMADKANTGYLFVADTSPNTADATKRFALRAGESIGLRVGNRNAVWLDTDVNGSKAVTTVEQ